MTTDITVLNTVKEKFPELDAVMCNFMYMENDCMQFGRSFVSKRDSDNVNLKRMGKHSSKSNFLFWFHSSEGLEWLRENSGVLEDTWQSLLSHIIDL